MPSPGCISYHNTTIVLGQVSADDRAVLDRIIDSLTSLTLIAKTDGNIKSLNKETDNFSLRVGKVQENDTKKEHDLKRKPGVLILGAGRVCQPAAELLASIGSTSSRQWFKTCIEDELEEQNGVHVIVASLYLRDAEEV